MSSQEGLGRLAHLWQTRPHRPLQAAGLTALVAARARRTRRRLRTTLAIETIGTSVLLGLLGWWMPPVNPRAFGWWVLVLIHVGTVWALVLWERRGLWSGLPLSTKAFVVAMRTRAMRQEVEVRWLAGLLGVEALAVLGWRLSAMVLEPNTQHSLIAMVAHWIPLVAMLAALAGLGLYYRASRRELAWVDQVAWEEDGLEPAVGMVEAGPSSARTGPSHQTARDQLNRTKGAP